MTLTDARATTGFGYVVGTLLVAVGVLGFAMTGFDDLAGTHGETLFGLQVNPLHNLVHVGTGLALVVGASHDGGAAPTIALLTAAAFGVIGMLGLALVGTEGNVLALNQADNVVHLGIAAAAGAAYAVDVRGRTTARPDVETR